MNLIEKQYPSNLFIRNDNPNGIFYSAIRTISSPGSEDK